MDPGEPLLAVASQLLDYVQLSGGTLSRMLSMRSTLHESPSFGASPDSVFPLPLMPAFKMPRRGRARLRGRSRNSVIPFANLVIVCMNYMYSGDDTMSRAIPTAAQGRVRKCIFSTVSNFLRGNLLASGEAEIQEYLQEHLHSYSGGGGHALPLGLRAGVPELAAQVELSKALEPFDAGLAEQVEHPSALLLRGKAKPKSIPRPFCRLDGSYPAYVKRNARAGLQVLKPLKKIYKFKGKPLYSGAFAVAKNSEEDRAISALCPLNALVNTQKMWKPRFAIMSTIRALRISPERFLRVYKKDARHFFHYLRIGHRWNKYMAHPPLPHKQLHCGAHSQDPAIYPVHRGVPMGFTAAASWAQAYNEAKVAEVGLPQDKRLIDDRPPPSQFPIWGSILDDVWALDECASVDDPPSIASKWLDDVAVAWSRDGVKEHEKKAVQGVLREEVQGVMIDGKDGWAGVSKPKRAMLLEAGLYLLRQQRPLVGEVDRWLGKLSFALSFRACARSVLQDIYTWLAQHRGKVKRAFLWPTVRAEMVVSMCLIPFLQSDLRADWCERVEASDAAPGGHGRAWTTMPKTMVAEAGRLCTHKGVHTNLQTEHGLATTGQCPMHQVRLPIEQFKWSTAARRGGYKHITLEEAIALNWSLHDRLKRPSECGLRVLHLVDSAAATGAYKKGRSASRKLNGCCRQACALVICSGIDPYFAWIPTDENPADEPSSRHGVRAGAVRTIQPASTISVDSTGASQKGDCWMSEKPWVRVWVERRLAQLSHTAYSHHLPKFYLHLCSGPSRHGDFCDGILRRANRNGVAVCVIRIDPVIHRELDLTDGTLVARIRDLCISNRVAAMLCSPPCSTWSRARHVPLKNGYGPRPLRQRSDPWVCLHDRTSNEVHSCQLGSVLMLACIYLLGFAQNCWRALEHPRDPGRPPFPSIFNTTAAALLRKHGMTDVVFDQCCFGAYARKPTQMLVPRDDSIYSLHGHFCKHSWHVPHIGVDSAGNFLTAPLAKYPGQLCDMLADLAWQYSPGASSCRNHGDWEHAFQAAAFPFEHPTKQIPTALHQRSERFQG